MNRYYSLAQNGTTADITIYGDITSWAWEEMGDTSAVNLSRKLEALEGVERINVYINSYGGEVAEGLAIYNALRRHPAQVVTYCDGFACSIASVIFMAGDVRVMNEASLLMIHNAWTHASGNAAELRKCADDLETITDASVAAYMAGVTISEEELRALMDNETWLSPADALAYGFCTELGADTGSNNPSQSARSKVQQMLLDSFMKKKKCKSEEDDMDDDKDDPDDDPDDQDEQDDQEEPDDTDDMDDPDDEEANQSFRLFEAIMKM